MHSIKSLQQLFIDFLGKQDFFSDPKELYEPIVYTMNIGGKRLRPVLLLLACDMYGGDLQKALYPAVGIEMFHNFTLVHDDIMDKAPIRRNMETVYKKWNTNIGILSGDTMFAVAFKYMMRIDNDLMTKVMDVFNQTAIEVCEGQQYDLNFEGCKDISIEDYMNMIRLKTAVLVGASLKTGAILARASDNECDKVYQFGLNTGIVFQLVDDLLDTYGDEITFGKRPGGDVKENKKTYLFLKGYERADATQRAALDRLFSDTSIDPDDKFKQVKEIWSALNVPDAVREEIQKYHKAAIENLNDLGANSEQVTMLRDYANSLVDRTF